MAFEIDWKAVSALPQSEQEVIKAELAEVQRLVEANPLQAYEPHEKQRLFHQAHTPIKAFIGGNRSGKSHAGIADDLIQAVDKDVLPEHLRDYKKWDPPFFCRIVSPDFTSTMEGVVFEKLRQLSPKSQLVGGSWDKAYDKQRRTLRFTNGSWFQFMTTEQDIDKFSGAALHRVHYDEEPGGIHGEKIRQENLLRLLDYNGEEVFTMTPLLGVSWVHDVIWEPVANARVVEGYYASDDIAVVQVDMDENPHLNQISKERILSGLTEEERAARKSGKFIHFQGLVYEEFEESKHVVETVSREQLKGQDIRVGIDPGIETTAVVFCAFDRDNAMLVFDELYLHGNDAVPEVAAHRIKTVCKAWGVKPSYYMIDPSARNRSLVNAEQVSGAYYRAGIMTHPGQNALEAGVFEMKRRLQHDPTALVVSGKCRHWLWECKRYRQQPRTDGEFGVIRKDNHLMDATRYVAMSRPIAPLRPKVARHKQVAFSKNFAPSWQGEPIKQQSGPMGNW